MDGAAATNNDTQRHAKHSVQCRNTHDAKPIFQRCQQHASSTKHLNAAHGKRLQAPRARQRQTFKNASARPEADRPGSAGCAGKWNKPGRAGWVWRVTDLTSQPTVDGRRSVLKGCAARAAGGGPARKNREWATSPQTRIVAWLSEQGLSGSAAATGKRICLWISSGSHLLPYKGCPTRK